MRTYNEPWAPVPQYRRRGRSSRAVAAAVTVVLAAVLIAGAFFAVRFTAEATLGQCAPSWLTGTDPQLCLNASVSRGTLRVSGTTSLPDGAIVVVWADLSGPGYDYRTTGSVPVAVTSGAFRHAFDISSWGSGTIEVTTRFSITGEQPRAVVDRYGWAGERLRGPDVQPDYTRGLPAPMEVVSSVQVDLSAS